MPITTALQGPGGKRSQLFPTFSGQSSAKPVGAENPVSPKSARSGDLSRVWHPKRVLAVYEREPGRMRSEIHTQTTLAPPLVGRDRSAHECFESAQRFPRGR